jgi:large subunit ribosomal protein L15
MARDPATIGLHSLKPKPGSRRPRKRIGRGEGSGLGKTSGRGHKGAGQRSGSKRKAGYEGGQNPVHMRMRKLRGPHMKKSMPFENFRTHTQPVNVATLDERFDAGAEVTPESLREAGLAKRSHPVKVLGRGEISTKLTVRAHAFSATAREKIEKAGGTCELIDPPKFKPPKRTWRERDAEPQAGGGKGAKPKAEEEPEPTDADENEQDEAVEQDDAVEPEADDDAGEAEQQPAES